MMVHNGCLHGIHQFKKAVAHVDQSFNAIKGNTDTTTFSYTSSQLNDLSSNQRQRSDQRDSISIFDSFSGSRARHLQPHQPHPNQRQTNARHPLVI